MRFKLSTKQVIFFVAVAFSIILTLGYFLGKIFYWEVDFFLWEWIVFGLIFLLLFLSLLLFFFYQVFQIKNKTNVFTSDLNFDVLKKIIDAQGSILIAFDKDLNVVWTNNIQFFVNFLNTKKFYKTKLTSFLNPSLIKQVNLKKIIKNLNLELKNRKTGSKERFNVSLIEDNIFLLQSTQVHFWLENQILNNHWVFFLLQVDLGDFVLNPDNIFETKQNQILAAIESELSIVFNEHKFWQTSPKKGLFVLLIKNECLQKLKKSHFNFIYDLTKKIFAQFRIYLTFSGGVYEGNQEFLVSYPSQLAIASENIWKKQEEVLGSPDSDIAPAYQNSLYALQMAIARSGDQIILTKPNNAFEVFGKQTQKLKVATDLSKIYQRFLRRIKKYESVVVVGHSNADLDVFGSALGVKFLLNQVYPTMKVSFLLQKVEQNIVEGVRKVMGTNEYDQHICKNSRLMLSQIKKYKKTALLLVDTNQAKITDLTTSQLQKFTDIFIIDHHVDNFVFKNPVFKFIDNKFSSTSEILTHFLEIFETEKGSINFPEFIMKMLLMGILIDTNNLQSNLRQQTIQAINYLSQKNVNVGKTIEEMNNFKIQFIPEKIESIIVEPAKVILKVFHKLIKPENASIIAEDYLVKGKIDVVFVVLFDEVKNIFVSARSKTDFNVEPICKSLGGGGDSKRGAAQIQDGNLKNILKKITFLIKKTSSL